MGSSWINTNRKEVEVTPLSKIFDRECPYYMSYGMSYDDYWYGDCFKAKFYREQYVLRLEKEDRDMLIQGMYIYEALCDVSPILHAFSKKGTKPLPYRTKTYSEEIKEKQEKERIENEKLIKQEQMKARIFFTNWFNATKKHFEK